MDYVYHCKDPSLDVVKYLVESGSNDNETSKNGESALTYYIKYCENLSV